MVVINSNTYSITMYIFVSYFSSSVLSGVEIAVIVLVICVIFIIITTLVAVTLIIYKKKRFHNSSKFFGN